MRLGGSRRSQRVDHTNTPETQYTAIAGEPVASSDRPRSNMNPQVFGAEPFDIGIGLIVDGQRHSDHSAPGIEVYDDRGEIEMLGRTAWLEVAFGSGWAVHALANKSLANDHVQGVVLENSGRPLDLDRACQYRVDTYHSITPGDRVVRVTGHNLRSNSSYLCFDIDLHLASPGSAPSTAVRYYARSRPERPM